MEKPKIVIIGSGASASQAALTLLESDHKVLMLDIGIEDPDVPLPHCSFAELIERLEDPYRYFLGNNFEGVVFPFNETLYVYPPNRKYLAPPNGILTPWRSNGFKAYLSHARGGLGVGWGGNCLEYDDQDFKNFPITRQALLEGYRIAGNRIGVCGTERDELGACLPSSITLQEPLRLNAHETCIYETYQRRVDFFRSKFGFRMGRARMAVLTQNRNERKACIYCSRCIWGCGQKSIYDPRQTIEECKSYSTFQYRSGFLVTELVPENNRVKSIAGIDLSKKTQEEIPADIVILGAGAVNSGAIFLRTLRSDPGLRIYWQNHRLASKSIFDTKVIRIPYILWKMIGRAADDKDFQFNKLNAGFIRVEKKEDPLYIHGELISFNGLLVHPLINHMPFGYRTNIHIFKKVRAALGALTLFLPDRPSNGNRLKLERDDESLTRDRICIEYQEPDFVTQLAKEMINKSRSVLKKLGGIVRSADIAMYPSGSGMHYAGTIPMLDRQDPLAVDPDCRSYRYKNLFVVDGAVFPELPSRSITFTLMANAIRVAGIIAKNPDN